MFKRSARFSTRQFNQVLEKGRVVHSPFFVLRFVYEEKKQLPRLAAVAPQKIFRTAVRRNKARRQIYEAVRSLYEGLPPKVSIIIFAKNPVITAPFTEIIQALKEIFVKAGLMR